MSKRDQRSTMPSADDDVFFVDDQGKVMLPEPKPVAAAAAPEPAPAPAAPVEPGILVDKFMRGGGPIEGAFVKCEKRVYGIRKLTRTQWAAEFERFKTQPR